MKKTVALFSLLVSTFILSACHENPLKKHTTARNAEFIAAASVAASKNFKTIKGEPMRITAYMDCMEEKNIEVSCPAFYKAMVDYAKKSKFKGFKGVRVADLTNLKVFEENREEYDLRFFWTI